MGVLHDYYRAPDRSTAATTLEIPPVRVLKRPDEPVFDAVDGKGIDPIVMLTTFWSLLTSVPYDELPQADFADVAVGGEDGPWITELPAQLRDALADADDGRLRDTAQQWVLTEEFGLPTAADDVLPFLRSSSPWRAGPATVGSCCTAGVACSTPLRRCRLGWQGVWDPLLGWSLVSCCEQDPLAQQVEAGTPVHLPLEHLDPVHGALHRARAVRQRQAVDHGGMVALQPGRKRT
jgi:hypothetical protein